MDHALRTLRSQLRQLADAHRSGMVDESAYASACAPLERALVDLVVGARSKARPSRRMVMLLTTGVIGIAIAGYLGTGAPGMLIMQPAASATPDATDEAAQRQVAQMVDGLAARLRAQPNDAEGWKMLARSYVVLDRRTEAVVAYLQAIALRGDDAALQADAADAIALQNGGRANAQSDRLIARALTIDPAQPKALALAGTSAFDAGDYATAIAQWERLAKLLPPESPDLPRLQASIAEARQRAGALAPAADAGVPSVPPAARAAAPPAPSVSGTVSLAPALAGRAGPDATLFVIAHGPDGSRLPLAVLRARVKDLPLAFTLDDTLSMSPAARLSGAAQVVVSARISLSGNVVPQPGDLTGDAPAVALGARGLEVRLDRVVTE
jgi:cytochrome c-type biogenesis protein CcmH